MATPLNVKYVVVKFGSKVLGCVQAAGFKISQETNEATCAGSNGWKEFSQGFQSWTGSLSGVYREFTAAELATEVAFDDILDVILLGTNTVTIEFSMVDAGGNPTGSRYKGTAILSEVSWDRPQKDNVTWSATLTGTGAFARIPGA